MIRNEANRSQNGQAESQVRSELPVVGTRGEAASPNSGFGSTRAPTSSSAVHSGTFGVAENLPTNNSFGGISLGYQVPNYEESMAQYPEARTNSDSGFVTAPSNSGFNPSQSDPGLGAMPNPTSFFHSRPHTSPSAANYPMFSTFPPAGTYLGLRYSQDSNMSMTFSLNGQMNMDPNFEGLVHVDQDAMWQSPNNQRSYQHGNADRIDNQPKFKGGESHDLDDDE